MDYSERVGDMYSRSAYIHASSGLPRASGMDMDAFFYELDCINAYIQ